jgi:hypothetical protein
MNNLNIFMSIQKHMPTKAHNETLQITPTLKTKLN